MDRQRLAQMVVDSCHRYDPSWAEMVCRYCSRTYGEHADDCEIPEVQRIANGEEGV